MQTFEDPNFAYDVVADDDDGEEEEVMNYNNTSTLMNTTYIPYKNEYKYIERDEDAKLQQLHEHNEWEEEAEPFMENLFALLGYQVESPMNTTSSST